MCASGVLACLPVFLRCATVIVFGHNHQPPDCFMKQWETALVAIKKGCEAVELRVDFIFVFNTTYKLIQDDLKGVYKLSKAHRYNLYYLL